MDDTAPSQNDSGYENSDRRNGNEDSKHGSLGEMTVKSQCSWAAWSSSTGQKNESMTSFNSRISALQQQHGSKPKQVPHGKHGTQLQCGRRNRQPSSCSGHHRAQSLRLASAMSCRTSNRAVVCPLTHSGDKFLPCFTMSSATRVSHLDSVCLGVMRVCSTAELLWLVESSPQKRLGQHRAEVTITFQLLHTLTDAHHTALDSDLILALRGS